jgi:general secretion pathway protein G
MMRQWGFTLIELVLSISILGVLASIAIPHYQNYQDRIKVNQAETDILSIGVMIDHYYTDNRSYPNILSDVWTKLDPWGNPYQYLNISSAKGNGSLRKDRSLNPINSDYDLYSMGKDG